MSIETKNGVCPTPQKITFENKAEAAKWAGRNELHLVPYECGCGRWHLAGEKITVPATNRVSKTKQKKEPETVEYEKIEKSSITLCLLGCSPLMMKPLAESAKRALLFPPQQKTTADKKHTLKHDPYAEFLDSIHTHDSEETLLCMPSRVFKKAVAFTALDTPGSSTKAQLTRTLWVPGDTFPIYGIPRIDLREVRNSDFRKTPDVRTRPILSEWAARVTIEYPDRIVSLRSMINLASNAGYLNGMGEDRMQKSGGGYGCWEVVNPDDERFVRIVEEQGREAQEAAIEDPAPYNDVSARLIRWFFEEARVRGFRPKEFPSITQVLDEAGVRLAERLQVSEQVEEEAEDASEQEGT